MAELLLELFSEEIPARMQGGAADDLKRLMTDRLAAANLSFDHAEAHAGPRRLTLVVDGLPERQPDAREEKRGPRVGSPEKAMAGFLKANGVTLDDCEKRTQGKAEYWFAVIERKGRATAELLPAMVQETIDAFPWPKSMRWGAGVMRWVRPLTRVLCVLDGDPVRFTLANGTAAGNITSGHRVHGPAEFEVAYFKDYSETLRHNKVIVDAAQRRRIIADGARALAAAEGLEVRHDPLLLTEVAGLVEWPVPLMGTIDARFMALPDEVLETSMRTHQKYLSLVAGDGTLAPRFIVVANLEAGDGGAAIVAGNERVLRARLADAGFFWDQDRKVTLEARVPRLDHITFHDRLGTVGQRVARLQTLAAELAPFIPGCDADLARRAALLAKADLTTGMVGEFAGLQGIMGRYYALADGEKPEVADAIARHYSPAGPGDDCPTAPVSIAVALADKIDVLVGFFAIDEKPTGSRDPFALRRAALGVIRLVLENRLRLPLGEAFRIGGRAYGEIIEAGRSDRLVADLLGFFADRLKVHLREQGVRHDLISAVFAMGGEDDLVRLIARVGALGKFLETGDGASLLVAYRRASNIVAIEEKKDGTGFGAAVESRLLEEDDEKTLHGHLADLGDYLRPVLAGENFDEAMALLATLRGPVDSFFDTVTVNCADAGLRANRLRLLSHIRTTMAEIADFSRIEGGER